MLLGDSVRCLKTVLHYYVYIYTSPYIVHLKVRIYPWHPHSSVLRIQAALRGEVQGTEGVLHDTGPRGHPRADAVAGIFHCQDVHLKAVPQLAAETVAAAQVLCVAWAKGDGTWSWLMDLEIVDFPINNGDFPQLC